MTWTKLPDETTDDLWDLSDGAFRLHLGGLFYANRMHTDGHVPESRLSTLVPRFRRADLDELVAAGRWVAVEGGYAVPEFLDNQPSRAEYDAQRDYDAIRQRKSNAPTPAAKAALQAEEEAAKRRLWEARNARRRTVTHVVTHSVTHDVTHTAPSRPVPSR